jgi:phospholipase C
MRHAIIYSYAERRTLGAAFFDFYFGGVFQARVFLLLGFTKLSIGWCR